MFNIFLYRCPQVPLSRTDKTPRMNARYSSRLTDRHHAAQGKRELCRVTLLSSGKWADLESPLPKHAENQTFTLKKNILF